MSSPRNIRVKTKFHEDVASFNDISSNATSSEDILPKTDYIDEQFRPTWRSWVVVFMMCFAQMAQVFVVVGSGQIIAFIVRDLGSGELAGWIIQGPLLMQSVLSPIIGRLSDVLDRKWLISVPPLIALTGAIISATATSMSVLIGGGVLIGVTLSTISILQAILSEILPLRYRAVANGAGFLGSAAGGIIGFLGAGAVTNSSPAGWKYVFWIQAAFHGATCIGLILLYNPPKRFDSSSLTFKQCLWAIDPLGSVLYITGTTLTLLALNWAPTYGWSNAHAIVPLCLGLFALLTFCLYEWKGREDGLLAHALFHNSPNFVLATFALAMEGWIFYSAVNSVVPQIILNLGFENNAWAISVRQLSVSIATIGACFFVMWYATKYKNMRILLLATLGVFLVATICYSLITPNMNAAQVGFNVLVGIGQAGPLFLLVATIQLETPHIHLSTATGLAFSIRAIGGAFGSAVLTAIIDGKLNSSYSTEVGEAAICAGLPRSSVADFIKAMSLGNVAELDRIHGSNQEIIEAAVNASHWAYARVYQLAWRSVIPFVVVAMIAVYFMKDVGVLMTETVEASVEPSASARREKVLE